MSTDAIARQLPLPKQYGEELLVIERGEGCRLIDRSGASYLDMGSGISVNALGYGRKDLADIAAEQMKKLIHASNLFATEPELELASKMVAAPVPGFAHAQFEAVHLRELRYGSQRNGAQIRPGCIPTPAKGKITTG